MRVAAGVVAYRVGVRPCVGTGIKWSTNELDCALANSVVSVLTDELGSSELHEILGPLGESDFKVVRIKQAVAGLPSEDWRVGEAIAEVYLTDWRNCVFPWPMSRDARRPGVSLPGADLVGLTADEAGDCLAFGEVKTSSQRGCPPSVMHGRSGLRQQVEDLRDCKDIQHSLIRYLGIRCLSGQLRQRFARAMGRYCSDTKNVHIYGVLIRDVDPSDGDLRTAIRRLAIGCSSTMQIELLAIYLPKGRISGLSQELAKVVNGGGE